MTATRSKPRWLKILLLAFLALFAALLLRELSALFGAWKWRAR